MSYYGYLKGVKQATMKVVNIAELKNRLSFYLTRVQAGEELIVRDRNRPIARLSPLAPSDAGDERLAALAVLGHARLGEGPIEPAFWQLPAPRVSRAVLRRAVQEERDED